jgi:hypothetical protein
MEHSGDDARQFTVEGKPHPKLDLKNPISQAQRVLTDLDSVIERLVALCDDLEKTPSVRKLCERMGGRRR